MNADQIGGLIRTLLSFGAGILISKGYVDTGTAGTVVSALVTIGVAVWSWHTNKPGTVIPAAPAK
jgi:hypothetical protein